MNKQLTKKTIGIAASAALMASVAFSSSALAAPGGNGNGNGPKDGNGPQGSIAVTNTCEVTVNPIDKSDVVLTLTSVIEDKSTGDGAATNVAWSAQAQEKYKGRDLYAIGDVQTAFYAGIPEENGVKTVTVVKTFDLCDASSETVEVNGDFVPKYPGMSTYAKAANAQTTVMIDDGHKVEGWISRCVDPDLTDDIDQLASLKLEQGLCPANTDRQDD